MIKIFGNRFTCIAIVGIFLMTTLSVSAIANNDDWYMFHHDSQHTGISTSQAPDYKYLLWKQKVGDYVRSSPSIVDGWGYVGAHGGIAYDDVWGKIICLNSETGTIKWEYDTDNWVYSTPCVVDNKVYCGCHDGKMYCLDADTGDLNWYYTTGSWVVSSPIVLDGRVYFGSLDSNIYCLNSENGELIWSYQTGKGIMSSPAIVDNRLYVGSKDDKLYCLDINSGSPIWSKALGDIVDSSPTVFDGKVFVASENWDPSTSSYYGMIHCLNAQNGDLTWNDYIGYVTSSPAVLDNKVFVGSYDMNMYCYNAINGEQIWKHNTNDRIGFSSPAIADNKLFIGSGYSLYCIDINHNSYLWDYKADWQFYGLPAVYNNKVYIGSEDGNIYCFSDPPSNPPNKPSINGPEEIKIGLEYEYTISATDPDNDNIYYIIDWGDTQKEILGPYSSGETIKAKHAWAEKGTYTIKASAKDIYDSEGYISTLGVTMKKNKATSHNAFLLKLFERHPLIYQILQHAQNL